MTADIAALIDACTPEKKAEAVIGHGWGANVAWVFAMDYPSKVERLVVLNGPHPSVFKAALSLFTCPQSAMRYWYWCKHKSAMITWRRMKAVHIAPTVVLAKIVDIRHCRHYI